MINLSKQRVLLFDKFNVFLYFYEVLYQWFSEEYSVYGVICGLVSGIVVLDIDDEKALTLLTRHYPNLLDTYTAQSRKRRLPDLYWRVKFPVKTQKSGGTELKGEGSYVVGAGSEIADHRWMVINDVPVREITPEELTLVCTLLTPEKKQIPRLITEHPTCYLSKRGQAEACPYTSSSPPNRTSNQLVSIIFYKIGIY